MEIPIENFAVYHLSKKTRILIKEGSQSITIIKRVGLMGESTLKMNREELAILFHVLGMRKLTEEALKNIPDKGVDRADD